MAISKAMLISLPEGNSTLATSPHLMSSNDKAKIRGLEWKGNDKHSTTKRVKSTATWRWEEI